MSKETLLKILDSKAKVLTLCRHLKSASPDGRLRPPLYSLEGESSFRPLFETRYLEGQWREVVLLDSPQSQANRLEMILLELKEKGKIPLPDIYVCFNDGTKVSQYLAPHRIYDAIFRDSLYPDGKPFFDDEPGQSIGGGDLKAIFKWSPNVLIFGAWHSHGDVSPEKAPRFPRLVLLEVLGIGPKEVHRTSSRRDPLMIPGTGSLATKELNLPERLKKKGKLDEVGYGTLPPSIKPDEVSVEDAVLVGTVSLVALRRLTISEDVNVNKAAQASLLGLLLLAVAEQDRTGYRLRSGTDLIPEGPLAWKPLPEVDLDLGPLGDPDSLAEAIEELQKEVGDLAWPKDPIELRPTEGLKKLFEWGQLGAEL